MYSPVWLGLSWAVPDPADAFLRVWASAGSGPETQPGQVGEKTSLKQATH